MSTFILLIVWVKISKQLRTFLPPTGRRPSYRCEIWLVVASWIYNYHFEYAKLMDMDYLEENDLIIEISWSCRYSSMVWNVFWGQHSLRIVESPFPFHMVTRSEAHVLCFFFRRFFYWHLPFKEQLSCSFMIPKPSKSVKNGIHHARLGMNKNHWSRGMFNDTNVYWWVVESATLNFFKLQCSRVELGMVCWQSPKIIPQTSPRNTYHLLSFFIFRTVRTHEPFSLFYNARMSLYLSLSLYLHYIMIS